MISTFEQRLDLSPSGDLSAFLADYGALYGRLLRKLYAARCAGRSRNALKRDFCARYRIPARLFNALWVDLQGRIDARKENLKQHRELLQRRIAAQKRKRNQCNKEPERKGGARRLSALQHRLVGVQAQLKRKLPPLCFGSGALLRQRHAEGVHLGHWRVKWERARRGQVYLLGSKDEACGNQLAQLSLREDGQSWWLQLRVPDCLAGKYGKYVNLPLGAFPYGQETIAHATERGQAITWRLVRAKRGWRVLASTAIERVPLQSRRNYGALGVDLNVGFAALARIDPQGNPVEQGRLSWVTRGLSRKQRLGLAREVAAQIVALAASHRVPIVLERLQMKGKKARDLGQSMNRTLSSWAYAQMATAIRARAAREGIEVIGVNPAYTSVIGRVKYALRYGYGTHQAAAVVIARRALPFTERLPRHPVRVPVGAGSVPYAAPVRMPHQHDWACWAKVATQLQRLRTLRKLCGQHAAGRGPPLRRSPCVFGTGETMLTAKDIPFDFPGAPPLGPQVNANRGHAQVCAGCV